MNTTQLKKFAQGARLKLLEQVEAKLNFVLTHDTAELRGKAEIVRKLKEELAKIGQKALVDKVAYTWFNRLIALRFMDVNGYQPLGISIVTPSELTNSVSPQILEEAHSGNILSELNINKSDVLDLLDGRVSSNNPDNDAYRILLVASCNQLNSIFPFLFEKINDYTELLLPDDLTSQFSIVKDINNGMSKEDCTEVEIIGWLYQFYVSDLNEELISSKKKYDKDELAPASQLFTPKWIVQYMVDNTLGQLWTEINPQTKITERLDFYIKPAYKDILEPRVKKSIEEIKFFEPCVGSGHILSYAYDVFYNIYEEQGYNPVEIPTLILENNLWGIDIDPRAAQMASFVLMMKSRQKQKRFFNTVVAKKLQPNIYYYEDFDFDNKFKNATALGSLVNVEPHERNSIKVETNSLFGERQLQLSKLYNLLGQRYDVVVTNPPYINSSRLEGSVKQYIESKYPEAKTDLFATFILRCLELCNEDGLTGFMTPFVWMFISSYEKLREAIIDKHFINNLIQLEYSGFDGATVPICTFTLRNKFIPEGKGSYIRLSDFKGSQNQAPKTLEAIQNPNCEWFFSAKQKDFEKIPGSPIGYWVGKGIINAFNRNSTISQFGKTRKGMVCGGIDRFGKLWHEIEYEKINLNALNSNDAVSSQKMWFPYAKGGAFCKWYGNHDYVVNWFNDGFEIRNTKHPTSERMISSNYNLDFIFKKGITWTDLSSGKFGSRYLPNGFLFDTAGPSLFIDDDENYYYILSFLNTGIANTILSIINPTMHFLAGNVAALPLFISKHHKESLSGIGAGCIDISKLFYDQLENSWNFAKNNLIKINCSSIEETYDLYQEFGKNKFYQLHKNEEEINRQFIEIYGLQDELNPEIPIEEVTILKEETNIENGELVFNAEEVFSQFVSYAVGCMFGRYSLDKEGLILANQGDSLQAYIEKVGKNQAELSFIPDEDNIIPILDDEWFEDDIVSRFHAFLKSSFGEKEFQKNLAFVEECLGKDIRKYFVKDFYNDHIKRYKKRPIYWLFSSPKGSFSVLIYLHRYTPDTLNKILNSYLREFIEKLNLQRKQLEHIEVNGTPSEQSKARKEIDKIDIKLADCKQYEAEILYPLASERIALDLDDGVLVNYNKLGLAVATVPGLNDMKTKNKVKEFDWIDTTQIR
jgi:type II restriction/modification system DNA methylase subunit YeeA